MSWLGVLQAARAETLASTMRPVHVVARTCVAGAAARASLRSGDRRTYLRAVNAWESVADFNERQGELVLHFAIRARLRGDDPNPGVRLPASAAKLIKEDR